MESRPTSLRQSLGALEYFTFGFGSIVGAGWLVVIDDWLRRGGPGGAMLGFLAGALLFLPIAHTYGRLVRLIPDAGACRSSSKTGRKGTTTSPVKSMNTGRPRTPQRRRMRTRLVHHRTPTNAKFEIWNAKYACPQVSHFAFRIRTSFRRMHPHHDPSCVCSDA